MPTALPPGDGPIGFVIDVGDSAQVVFTFQRDDPIVPKYAEMLAALAKDIDAGKIGLRVSMVAAK